MKTVRQKHQGSMTTRGFINFKASVALPLVVIFSILGLLVYSYFEARDRLVTRAESQGLQLIRLASSNHELIVEEANHFLTTLSLLPELHSGNPAVCSQFLADLREKVTRYANLGVASLDGNIYCSALPMTKPVNAADRLYFQKAVRDRQFSVGQYQVGRITGKRTLNFGYPLLADNQEVEAVLFAALDLFWLNEFLDYADPPDNSTVYVVDKEGIVLSRYPTDDQYIGKQAPDSGALEQILSAKSPGTTESVNGDGAYRYYAYAPLQGTSGMEHVYAAIAVTRQQVINEAIPLGGKLIIGFLATMAFMVLVAWLWDKAFHQRRGETESS